MLLKFLTNILGEITPFVPLGFAEAGLASSYDVGQWQLSFALADRSEDKIDTWLKSLMLEECSSFFFFLFLYRVMYNIVTCGIM